MPHRPHETPTACTRRAVETRGLRTRPGRRAHRPGPRARPDLGRRQHQRAAADHGRRSRRLQRTEHLAGP